MKAGASTKTVLPSTPSNRFASMFAVERAAGRKALGVYLTVGDPSVEVTERAARAAIRAGADFIELGAPFSDPSADGPVIQKAMERALANKTTLHDVARVAKTIRQEFPTLPVIWFGYANPFFVARHEPWFLNAISDGLVDGLLLVDVPPEHGHDFAHLEGSVPLIRLLGPNATPARRAVIGKAASGFIYLVAIAGVTGAASVSSATAVNSLVAHAKALRRYTQVPLCVGFGIKSGADAQRLSEGVDGVIAGSVFVDLLTQSNGVELIEAKVRELKTALR